MATEMQNFDNIDRESNNSSPSNASSTRQGFFRVNSKELKSRHYDRQRKLKNLCLGFFIFVALVALIIGLYCIITAALKEDEGDCDLRVQRLEKKFQELVDSVIYIHYF